MSMEKESAREILKVEDLTVKFDEEVVINDLSFSVMEKDVLVILGPNGAGKTTLLRTLLGLVPHEGRITWKKEDIAYMPPQELFGRKELPPLRISEFFRFKQSDQEKVRQGLKDVGLEETVLDKKFGTLSTGQFQRMIIAWSLVNDPSVLLFDEPTAGIDIGGQETIYSLLHKFWKERGLTILLVTHEMNVVWEHARNVLCLNKKKLCYGRPKKVLTPETLEKLYGTGIKFYEHQS